MNNKNIFLITTIILMIAMVSFIILPIAFPERSQYIPYKSIVTILAVIQIMSLITFIISPWQSNKKEKKQDENE